MARPSWMGHFYIAGHPGISDFLSILGTLSPKEYPAVTQYRICLVMSGNKMGRFTQKQGEFRK
ncbi:MAG: hypothetical protein C0611_12235 [Desulfobacteraceae bacterium]|jgi:hypothetical protein|nr:MAG: hypothetical protein C0611_12235 [Desulfobacteraceae bacterium]